MKFFQNLANAFYGWTNGKLLTADKNYQAVFSDNSRCGHGFEYGLYVLLATSILSAVIFYYFICNNSSNATKKNYLAVGLMGLITMVVLLFVTIGASVENVNIMAYPNMYFFVLINVVCFIILFEVVSLLIKSGSKGSNIHLLS